MPYDLKNRLVIGLASSALFDLTQSDKVWREKKEAAYRVYQRKNQNVPLNPGVAFPFVKRLLSLNSLSPEDPLVEVILLSKNDPDTGMRVMNSIKHHGLDITRAVFLQGRSPHDYIPALDISLFLSAEAKVVKAAVKAGYPAGQVLESKFKDNPADLELRIAFDFDGVLGDDGSESVYRKGGLKKFQEHETAKAEEPLAPGPMAAFLKKLSLIQNREMEEQRRSPSYEPRVRTAIVTARSAPAHERVVNTMRSWGVTVNEAFFLGGIEKRAVLDVLKPHIFFDDQEGHLKPAAERLACVHIPFGVANEPSVPPVVPKSKKTPKAKPARKVSARKQ